MPDTEKVILDPELLCRSIEGLGTTERERPLWGVYRSAPQRMRLVSENSGTTQAGSVSARAAGCLTHACTIQNIYRLTLVVRLKDTPLVICLNVIFGTVII